MSCWGRISLRTESRLSQSDTFADHMCIQRCTGRILRRYLSIRRGAKWPVAKADGKNINDNDIDNDNDNDNDDHDDDNNDRELGPHPDCSIA